MAPLLQTQHPVDGSRLAAAWGWLSRRRRQVIVSLVVIGAALIALTAVVESHAHFAWEAWPGAYAAAGFAGSAGIGLLARAARRALTGGENDDE